MKFNKKVDHYRLFFISGVYMKIDNNTNKKM
jgi:hypothetical protein